MSAPAIITRLNAAGVRLTRRGGNLLAEPKSAVTAPLLALLKAHKDELLAALPDATERATIAPEQRRSTGERVGHEAELAALVEAVGAFYDTPADQYPVMLEAAEGDVTAALECFRSLAARHGITVH